ncbi:unnamed protein product [Heterosigma akashiwo]
MSLDDPLAGKTVGFIGCGKITTAVAKGLARGPDGLRPRQLIVSPRSTGRSTALKQLFPTYINIAQDNEEVVEQSDIIMLGLLPDVAQSILPALTFRQDQLIVSMMATPTEQELFGMVRLPHEQVLKTIPLPGVDTGDGVVLAYPAATLYARANFPQLLSLLGTAVPCTQEAELKPLIALTANLSPFYEWLDRQATWAADKGVDPEVARRFVQATFEALVAGAGREGGDGTPPPSFAELGREAATPGGLNEQAVEFLREEGHFDLLERSNDAILRRL